MAGISSRTYMSVWAERWKGLTKREKDAYSIQHTKVMAHTQRLFIKKELQTASEIKIIL